MRYTFSGHESFQCKGLWLKKGYDFAKAGKSFNDDYAVVGLGVGKNMVSSIRYWLKAFGVVDENGRPTEIGKYLLDNDGVDPYIEDTATQWLLHYLLVTTKVATLYHLIFTEFNRTRREFNKTEMLLYVRRAFVERRFGGTPYNENTVSRDIATLLKNYVYPESAKVCEDYSALLLDLKLIGRTGHDTYTFNTVGKAKPQPLVFLFAILDKAEGEVVVEFDKLLSLANIFGMSVNDLYDTFEKLHEYNAGVSFSNAAGEQLFSMKEPLDKWQVLNDYYGGK